VNSADLIIRKTKRKETNTISDSLDVGNIEKIHNSIPLFNAKEIVGFNLENTYTGIAEAY
jgi:hypothetical protein